MISDGFLNALLLGFLGRRELPSEVVEVYVLVSGDYSVGFFGGRFYSLRLGSELALKLSQLLLQTVKLGSLLVLSLLHAHHLL